MSSAPEQHLLPPPKPKLSPLELRNTDLVSRLLAATPPYLYNMSLLPNTYFFSEMLRSFVQAKNEQRGTFNGGNPMYYGHPMRRSRKRGWSTMTRDYPQPIEEKPKPVEEDWLKSMRKSEEALELTAVTPQKMEDNQQKSEDTLFSPPQDTTSNLVLPPPPPMWYPPIYPTPPYGIDPLHFFIDLRVSGHIYDRQKDGEASSTIVSEDKKDKPEEGFTSKRHCSAFSVPKNRPEKSPTKFDVKSMGFDKGSNKTSTNYIMGNISDIYKNVSQKTEESINVDTDDKSEEEKQKKVKDLRALIGLELVVDYMSHKKPRSESEEGEVSSVESCESPQLEVVAVHDEV